MTAMIIWPKGRRPKNGAVRVPRSAYADIFRRHQGGQECAADIAKDYGIRPAAVRNLVQRCKHDPSLLEA